MTILLILLFIEMPVLAYKDSSVGFLQKLGNMAAAPFVAMKDHMEDFGKGKQAVCDLNKSNEIISAQQEIIKTIIVEKQVEKVVLEQVTESNLNLASKHTETNNILSGALQFGQVVGTACSFVYIGKVSYDLGHWIYRYFWPSQETILRKKKLEQKAKSFDAKMGLHKCLGNHLGRAKNNEGLPIGCENEARLLVSMGGIREYKKIINDLQA